MIRCIIIEDEPLAAERLQTYIRKMPDLQLEGWFDSGEKAIAYLKENTPDLIFLDLHLGESSGIRLMETGAIKGNVIITTAYSQYALKGYELDVIDYLLKPFVFDRFEQAVHKAIHRTESRAGSSDDLFILVRSEYRLEKIYLRDIIYIEGMGDYRRIHTTTSRIMTLQTFKEFEATVSPEYLVRIHKSYMINPRRIKSRGAGDVEMEGGVRLPQRRITT